MVNKQSDPLLVGMVHLTALPGSPGWAGPHSRGETPAWLERAVADAQALVHAGFRALLVENFGDAPFYPRHVPPETCAAMARAATSLRACLPDDVRLGVNVLRNDGETALAIAGTCDLDFIRINVLSGAYATDQGVIEGRAADLLRMRTRLSAPVSIWADVRVKHAAPLVRRDLIDEAQDLLERGCADALIVSGGRTGAATNRAELETLRRALPHATLLVGSGASADTLPTLLQHADGAIVGTALKQNSNVHRPVDPARAAKVLQAGYVT